MCTATWLLDGDGSFFLFTRDELHRRSPAQPPAPRESGVTRYIAPLDPDGGGTWIAVTQTGLILGLLNDYPPGFALMPRGKSRGLLIPELIARVARWWSPSAGVDGLALEREVRDLAAISHLQPFQLVVRGPECRAAWYGSWDGLRLQTRAGMAPETISSVRTKEMAEKRREIYRHMAGARPTRELLRRYHRFRGEDAALGPWMWRPEAGSQSLTEIAVTRGTVSMTYREGPDAPQDLQGFGSTETLPRIAEA